MTFLPLQSYFPFLFVIQYLQTIMQQCGMKWNVDAASQLTSCPHCGSTLHFRRLACHKVNLAHTPSRDDEALRLSIEYNTKSSVHTHWIQLSRDCWFAFIWQYLEKLDSQNVGCKHHIILYRKHVTFTTLHQHIDLL